MFLEILTSKQISNSLNYIQPVIEKYQEVSSNTCTCSSLHNVFKWLIYNTFDFDLYVPTQSYYWTINHPNKNFKKCQFNAIWTIDTSQQRLDKCHKQSVTDLRQFISGDYRVASTFIMSGERHEDGADFHNCAFVVFTRVFLVLSRGILECSGSSRWPR